MLKLLSVVICYILHGFYDKHLHVMLHVLFNTQKKKPPLKVMRLFCTLVSPGQLQTEIRAWPPSYPWLPLLPWPPCAAPLPRFTWSGDICTTFGHWKLECLMYIAG